MRTTKSIYLFLYSILYTTVLRSTLESFGPIWH